MVKSPSTPSTVGSSSVSSPVSVFDRLYQDAAVRSSRVKKYEGSAAQDKSFYLFGKNSLRDSTPSPRRAASPIPISPPRRGMSPSPVWGRSASVPTHLRSRGPPTAVASVFDRLYAQKTVSVSNRGLAEDGHAAAATDRVFSGRLRAPIKLRKSSSTLTTPSVPSNLTRHTASSQANVRARSRPKSRFAHMTKSN